MSECKPCQLVECVPANDYTYSLALPPPPAQPPPPFGNDELSYCCPSGTISVSGTIPAWIEVNTVTNCVSVVPNTFRASDKAVANGTAQNALNQFVAAQVSCTVAPTEFFNAPQVLFVTCSDLTPGQEGPSECCSVDGGIFSSAISQAEADQHAVDAANAVLAGGLPGPCCNAPTMIQDFAWTVTPQSNSDPGDTQIVPFVWDNIVNTGPMTFVCSASGGSSHPENRGALILIEEDFCNPWPVYGVSVHVEWDWAFHVEGTDTTYAGIQFFPKIDDTGIELLSLYNSSSDPVSGSGTYDFPPGTIDAGGARILLQILVVVTGNPTTLTLNITKLTISPLIPPNTLPQTCSQITSWTNPTNDYWANAELVAGGSGTVTGNMTDATLETGETSLIVSTTISRSLWYKWVAPANGSITFTTQGSTLFDTLLAAYTGISVGTLTQIAADEGSHGPPPIWSEVTFVAVIGTTYYLQVSSTGTVGAVTLNWFP